jgi:SAM-dependent methyltransferase
MSARFVAVGGVPSQGDVSGARTLNAVSLTEHERKNRLHWDAQADDYQAAHGAQLAKNPMAWGAWSIPEDELHVLGDVLGKDVAEIGCGGAQWSIALAKRGARCVGIDTSLQQLEHAKHNIAHAGVDVRLLHASAESVPLPSKSFDIIFCDHGAMTFADPQRTVPESARLLRPGGLLAFCAESPLHFICWDERQDHIGTALYSDYFERRQSDDGESVVFSLPYGEWIKLFRTSGFIVEDLIELRPAENSRTTYNAFVTKEWARRWPAEQIWRVRKS